MKILFQINSVANSRSTGRIAEGIGNAAIAAGFSSYIAYGRYANPSSSHLIQVGQKKDYLLHCVRSRILDDHGMGSVAATRALLKQMDEIRPDIVHLHNIHGYYLNYPLLFQYLKDNNVPVVWTLHDCWPFTGHCAHFDYAKCECWKTGCHHCPQKTTYPASYVLDRSKQNWLAKKYYFTLPDQMLIVPCSYWLGDLVKKSFLGKYPVNVIHNGINTEVFRPCSATEIRSKHGWENKKILLGVASSWSPRKGLKDFIELSKLLPGDYCIVLVGLNPEQMKDLPANIIAFAKTESVQMLAELYSAADVFLNLTWEDNYPTTNLEAIACGTPVITYRTGGSPESISKGTGFVVEQGNLQGVLRAVPVLHKNVEVCREYALANFRQEDRFQEYVNLYQRLLKENG